MTRLRVSNNKLRLADIRVPCLGDASGKGF